MNLIILLIFYIFNVKTSPILNKKNTVNQGDFDHFKAILIYP